jgi:hypothetical protein
MRSICPSSSRGEHLLSAIVERGHAPKDASGGRAGNRRRSVATAGDDDDVRQRQMVVPSPVIQLRRRPSLDQPVVTRTTTGSPSSLRRRGIVDYAGGVGFVDREASPSG